MGSVSIVGSQGRIIKEFTDPTDIDGLLVWLEAESLGLSDTDPIGTWTDLSGLGNHMTQSDGTKKPIYKTAIVNGLAVARFDATNDGMSSSLTVNAPFTVYAVANYAGGGGGRRMIGGSANWLIGPYGGTWQYHNGAFINDSTADSTFRRLCVTQTGSGGVFYVDNASVGSNANTGTPGSLRLAGDSAFGEIFGGDLAEVIVYDTEHDASQRLSVDAYLEAKYGL